MKHSTIAGIVAACLAVTVGHARAQKSGSAILICGFPPADAECRVPLGPKDTNVVVLVKPTETGTGNLVLTADHCCVSPMTVRPDSSGLIPIHWSSPTVPDTTVHVYVYIPRAGRDPLRGDVTLVPPPAPAPQPIHVSDQSRQTQYVWTRGGYVPSAVVLDIDQIGGKAPQQGNCESVKFTLVPRLEGKATPDTGYARWLPNGDASSGLCRIETRWKLGDAANQQLDVTLSGKSLVPQRLTTRGFGRLDPRVMGGLGVFRNIVRDIDIQCDSASQQKECAHAATFPTKVTVTQRRNGVEPYGAVEFPLIFATRFTGPVSEFLLRRIRLAGGTTLKHPARNPFAAIDVMPFVDPFLEGVPFQLTIGTTVSKHREFFYGVSVDATLITKPLVGIFGLTGS